MGRKESNQTKQTNKTQDTNGKETNSQLDTTNESQVVNDSTIKVVLHWDTHYSSIVDEYAGSASRTCGWVQTRILYYRVYGSIWQFEL